MHPYLHIYQYMNIYMNDDPIDPILLQIEEPTKMSMVGVAIFPDVASSFNHSCDPNTFVVDMGQVCSGC